MKNYEYKSVILNYKVYLVPIHLCTLEFESAISKIKALMSESILTLTFKERNALHEGLSDNETISLC